MEGQIELIEVKEKGLRRMKISGVFYSYFGKDVLKEGDVVDFEFAEKGKYKTIEAIQVKAAKAQEYTFKDRSIMKQTALKCACMTYRIDDKTSVQDQVKTILKIADTFEKHLVE